MGTGWQASAEDEASSARREKGGGGVGKALLEHMEYVHPLYLSRYAEGGHAFA